MTTQSSTGLDTAIQIGLFVGAVVMVLGFTLFMSWVKVDGHDS